MNFELDTPKKGGTNRYAQVDCETCGGDRMIVYETRPDQTSGWMSERGIKATGESEQLVPCPSCNADANTRREGFKSPDPAKVRERLAHG